MSRHNVHSLLAPGYIIVTFLHTRFLPLCAQLWEAFHFMQLWYPFFPVSSHLQHLVHKRLFGIIHHLQFQQTKVQTRVSIPQSCPWLVFFCYNLKFKLKSGESCLLLWHRTIQGHARNSGWWSHNSTHTARPTPHWTRNASSAVQFMQSNINGHGSVPFFKHKESTPTAAAQDHMLHRHKHLLEDSKSHIVEQLQMNESCTVFTMQCGKLFDAGSSHIYQGCQWVRSSAVADQTIGCIILARHFRPEYIDLAANALDILRQAEAQ